MSAILRTSLKLKIKNRFVIEYSIYEVPKSSKYPDGVKYGLICKDLETDDFVLFDNHHPKGPHIHFNDQEFEYQFKNEEQLMEDFKLLVFERMGIRL